MTEPVIPTFVGSYQLENRLGAGYSGSIWRARHIHTGHLVAIKLQRIDHECPTNRYERGFYPLLYGALGMPTLWASGVQGPWDYLAIDLLGPSLDSLHRSSGQDCFDLRTVCCVAQQLIERLSTMHERGVLHRDIQLGNCTLGLSPNERTLYMIDFGFSKRYLDPETRRHIPESNKKRDFIGNYWFSSIGVHCKGKVPSRRDDLEAAALMLIHMLTPKGLPWTRNGIPKDDEAHDRLKLQKQAALPHDLCRGLPAPFEEFLRYCRRLKFAEAPDYDRWIDEFNELGESYGFGTDYAIIWPSPPAPRVTPGYVPRRSDAPPPDDMEAILAGLGNLNLAARPILGDRVNVDHAIQRARQSFDVIDLTDESSRTTLTDETGTEDGRGGGRRTKAHLLSLLTFKLKTAEDNRHVGSLVEDFVSTLKLNSSRALTKEGFAFLDALYKRLAGPDATVPPFRTQTHQQDEELDIKEASNARLKVVAGLRREVKIAISCKALASLVADFGRLINKSPGRTVTKDGYSFLSGLAERLKVV